MANGQVQIKLAAERRAREQAASQTAESSFTNVDPMGNYVGGYDELAPETERKLKLASQARSNFASQDPRRLDIGDGGKAAIAATVAQSERRDAAAAAEEQRKAAEEAKKPAVVEQVRPVITSFPPQDNPLFQYADYTYNLSLHVIPPSKYNALATIPGYIYTNDDNTVLIASGGRRNDSNFTRHTKFKQDFYFENLKFTTIVGLNNKSRNTNSIDLSFTIIEPYGVTMLNRMRDLMDELDVNSWMQLPFMLQIDFVGNTDQGEVMHPIPDTTKYIPVRLIGCKIKVTNKGAEYQLQAIPYSHQAFNESSASTPAQFEVTAKTIADFFSSSGNAGQADNVISTGNALAERREALSKELKDEKYKTPDGKREAEKKSKEFLAVQQGVSSTGYVVGSYSAAINSFQKQLQANKQTQHPEIYEFKFHKDFESSEIVIPNKVEARNTKMIDPTTKAAVAAIRAQGGISTAGIDMTSERFSINAGTNVVEVINMVMRASKYIRDQIPDPATDAVGGGQAIADKLKRPINWYKITPVITIGEFDFKRDCYSKKITYHVEPYTYYNTKFRDAPQKLPDSYSKSYQYMYTGKNRDIISFDIDFDTMFYTKITADRSKAQKDRTQPQAEQSQEDNTNAPNRPKRITNNVVVPVAGQAGAPNPASVDSKSVLVNDLTQSMMSSSRGDMINVKLKIVGDPEFIKQDDVYFNPTNNPSQPNKRYDKNGSLIFDVSEIFALIKFKTPVDFNAETGLMEFETWETSVFSGIYKIITVENEFSRGQFVQTLDCIRMFDQPDYDIVQPTPDDGKKKAQEERAPEVTTLEEQKKQEEPAQESRNMTFGEAFKQARKDYGGAGGVFTWNGKQYQTNIVGEDYVSKPKSVYNDSRDLGKVAVTQQAKLKADIASAPTENINDGNIQDYGLG